MAKSPPNHPFDEVDPQQVVAFLDRIARDRDEELARAEQACGMETARIRNDAYREARSLHRRAAVEVRERVRREHDRSLSRLRAELRRSGWRLVADARERAMRKIRARFTQAWLDPDQRWTWCRYWLEQARQRATGQQLTVRCIGGSGSDVCARIRQWIDEHEAGWELRDEDSTDAGIVLTWDDQLLDGRLSAQYAQIDEHLQWQVTRMIHEPDPPPVERP